MAHDESSNVLVWVDGSTQQHSGAERRSGWAAVLVCKERARVIVGTKKPGTNNEMEAMAVLKALQLLKRPCFVIIHTDSQYVFYGFDRIANNRELLQSNHYVWEALKEEYERHLAVRLQKVKGHADNMVHNYCDKLARQASRGEIWNVDEKCGKEELFEKANVRG